MPRTIEPSIPKAGPLGMKVKRRKRRFRSGEQNSSSSQHLQQPPIASFGKPLEENFENSKSGVPCSANDGFDWEKENTSVVTDMPRNERTTTPQRIAKQTTAPKVLSANYSGKLKSKALVPNRTVEASRPVSAQRAARLGLALDTRSLMTSSSASPSSTSAEIVDHCKDFIRTLAARGAPPCIVATCSSLPNMNRSGTVSSCPIKPTSLKVSTFNIAKDAALLNLLTETNAAFSVVNINSDDVSSNGAMSIPCAMTAEQSWQLFGDMGKCTGCYTGTRTESIAHASLPSYDRLSVS